MADDVTQTTEIRVGCSVNLNTKRRMSRFALLLAWVGGDTLLRKRRTRNILKGTIKASSFKKRRKHVLSFIFHSPRNWTERIRQQRPNHWEQMYFSSFIWRLTFTSIAVATVYLYLTISSFWPLCRRQHFLFDHNVPSNTFFLTIMSLPTLSFRP